MRWIFYLYFLFFPFSSTAIEDVVPLSVGLENDYLLDESLRGRNLIFQGTYRKITELVYDKKKHTIRFSPRRTGVGTLIVKEGKTIVKKYTIDVRKTDLNRVAHEIKSLLKEVDGITITIINNKVTVDGEIFTPRDMKRIYNVIKEYPKQATSLVTLSTAAQNKVARFIEKEIGNPNITVKAANEKFILRGTVSSHEEKRNARIIAQLYAPSVVTDPAVKSGVVRDRDVKDVIIDLIKVKEPAKPEKKQNRLIQMIVHYVELNKDYNDLFRFQWAPRIEDGTNFVYSSRSKGSEAIGIIQGTINNFLPKLNWAKQFGFARILHTSNLIVEEAKPGTVSSMQNVPYTSLSNPEGGVQVQFANVGIKGKLTPYVVGSRKDGVRLEMALEVINLVGVGQGAPITNSRNIQTSLYIRSGLSAAVGGIISNNSFTGYNREPQGSKGDGDPLINLLSSKNFTRNQSQFVFFVTPIIKSSASVGVEKIKKKFKVIQ